MASEAEIEAAAAEIRNEQWDGGNQFAVGTAMDLWDARIVSLVTRESLESAALQMARYIVYQAAERVRGDGEEMGRYQFVLAEIARGRCDNDRPLAGEVSRQMARHVLETYGRSWPLPPPPKEGT